MSVIYRTVSTVRLYNGQDFVSTPFDSDYNFSNGIIIDEISQERDNMTELNLGNDRKISVRPSDVMYIDNVTTKVNTDEEVSEGGET